MQKRILISDHCPKPGVFPTWENWLFPLAVAAVSGVMLFKVVVPFVEWVFTKALMGV